MLSVVRCAIMRIGIVLATLNAVAKNPINVIRISAIHFVSNMLSFMDYNIC